MRIFVTGATGWVGSAVVEELIAAGHQVVGLARSEKSAEKLVATGASAMRGAIEDLDVLRSAAIETDGIIHTAFNHDDWSRFAENSATEKAAIEALGEALEGTHKPLIVTSGVALLARGRLATEEDTAPPAPDSFPRSPETIVEALKSSSVRACAIRLAPSVHGVGDRGFVPRLANIAREKGVSAYIGSGQNRWPAVHRRDVARLFSLALSNPEAGPFHAVAEEGIALKDIAEAIGRQLGLPVASVTADEAHTQFGQFGWFAQFVSLDAPTSSARTREIMGWAPKERGLLADLADPAYFAG